MINKTVLIIEKNSNKQLEIFADLRANNIELKAYAYDTFLHADIHVLTPALILFPMDVLTGSFDLLSSIYRAKEYYPEIPVVVLGPVVETYALKFFAVLGAIYFPQKLITTDYLMQIICGDTHIFPIEVDPSEELLCLREINRILSGKVFMIERETFSQVYQNQENERDIVFTRLNQMLIAKDEQLIQSEKLAVMGTLVAGLAHEIKNPLTAINGFLSVLRKQIQPMNNYRMDTAMDGIRLGVEHLNDLVNNFLEFSRRTKEEFVEVDIKELILKAVSIAAVRLKDNSISTEVRLPDDLPKINAIPGQLVQVFLNLIINAIHAMDDGGHIIIESTAGPTAKNIEITVSDDGHGIAPENLAKIFEAFFTTKDINAGAGLGLSITSGIIEKHKGFIDVKSELGRGTTFIIKLPTVYYE